MKNSAPVYLFYFATGAKPRRRSIAPGYAWEFWRPSLTRMIPVGLPEPEHNRFRLRWALHCLRIFPNREYTVFIVRSGGELVHYSGVTGRYWRFPFLTREDLQIGDVWTHPAHRGKGLAQFAIQEILATMSRSNRRIWYVVEEINAPSIRAAENAGMTLFARGTWHRPFGMKLLGSYVIRNVTADRMPPVPERTPELSSPPTRRA